MTPQPAVVISHGAWHTSEHYSQLCDALRNVGFLAICPQLPSQSNIIPPNASLADDTLRVRETVTELADAGHPIILFMHSYGGVVGSNAIEGLLLSQRRSQNPPLDGGVVHIFYMAAFVAPKGTALADPFGGELPPWNTEDVTKGILFIRDPRNAFFNHLPNEDAAHWLEKCVHCPTSVVKQQLTYTPYAEVGKGLDATYLVCTRDKELPTEAQEAMATLLGDHRRMEYLDSGHSAIIGAQLAIADVVLKAWESSQPRLKEVWNSLTYS